MDRRFGAVRDPTAAMRPPTILGYSWASARRRTRHASKSSGRAAAPRSGPKWRSTGGPRSRKAPRGEAQKLSSVPPCRVFLVCRHCHRLRVTREIAACFAAGSLSGGPIRAGAGTRALRRIDAEDEQLRCSCRSRHGVRRARNGSPGRRTLRCRRAVLPQRAGAHAERDALAVLSRTPAQQQRRNREGNGDLFVPDPLQEELDLLLQSGLSYELRGVRALESRSWPEAAALFRKGLELTHENTPLGRSLRHKLGTALYLSGDVRGAQEQFEEVVGLAPASGLDESVAK